MSHNVLYCSAVHRNVILQTILVPSLRLQILSHTISHTITLHHNIILPLQGVLVEEQTSLCGRWTCPETTSRAARVSFLQMLVYLPIRYWSSKLHPALVLIEILVAHIII